MNKAQFVLLGTLVLIGSIVGGAVVTSLFHAGDVQAASTGTYTIQISDSGGLAWVLNTSAGKVTQYQFGQNEPK